MEGRFDHEQEEEYSAVTPPPQSTADSPISGGEAYAPSPKKSRKGAHKKVVSVPICDGDGSRSKSEVYPPPDSWSWRKYGQKPIKGSPYPRGYYRCSGCPARKQVERSRLDPTTLLITYSCEHNHPHPTTTTILLRPPPLPHLPTPPPPSAMPSPTSQQTMDSPSWPENSAGCATWGPPSWTE